MCYLSVFHIKSRKNLNKKKIMKAEQLLIGFFKKVAILEINKKWSRSNQMQCDANFSSHYAERNPHYVKTCTGVAVE